MSQSKADMLTRLKAMAVMASQATQTRHISHTLTTWEAETLAWAVAEIERLQIKKRGVTYRHVGALKPAPYDLD